MSRKSERLVNLTIALLATKRFLTKSEIFRTVDGYEGTADSKDRMFERDKDDLRSLGVVIEVGSFDPLFEDEPGYRINPDTYEIQLKNLTAGEYSILLLAAQQWQGSALSAESLGALVKLKSLGFASDIDAIPGYQMQLSRATDEELATIVNAIADCQVIEFEYFAKTADLETRRIAPYGLKSLAGYWYLIGNDIDKKALRTFRLDRIRSEIALIGKSSAYVIPTDFNIDDVDFERGSIGTARVKVRKGKAHNLRHSAQSISIEDTWDVITLEYEDEVTLVHRVLWHLDDAILLEPATAVSELIATIANVKALHG